MSLSNQCILLNTHLDPLTMYKNKVQIHEFCFNYDYLKYNSLTKPTNSIYSNELNIGLIGIFIFVIFLCFLLLEQYFCGKFDKYINKLQSSVLIKSFICVYDCIGICVVYLNFLFKKTHNKKIYNICCICQDTPNFYIFTKCGHQYCAKCIYHWSKIKNKCPTCNQDL